ncbi:MAG: response regulator, partial [bacterium]|nr:response regulator [bacterium]
MKDRILVVDDDPDILQFVEMNLDMEGFDAQTALSGRIALEEARERPPDLILLDVMMPELDGLTVLRRLRSSPATSSIPVVLLTAKALAEDRVRG